MEKKEDRRVARTKRAIRNSFITLLAEKELDKITIKDVADGADVDRKTVYNYYCGVYEILDEIENELVSGLRRAVEEGEFRPLDAKMAFAGVKKLVEDNFELYALLMKVDSNSRLISKIVVEIREGIRNILKKSTFILPGKIDLAAEYVTAGVFAAYRYWFNSDRTQSLEDFTDSVAQLVMGGLPKYFFDL